MKRWLFCVTAFLFFIPVCINSAFADDAGKINAYIEAWGGSCKNEASVRLGPDVSKADIQVELGATLRTAIDAGKMTLRDIEKYGLSYNWEAAKKKTSGYCSTDGQGRITDFQFF